MLTSLLIGRADMGLLYAYNLSPFRGLHEKLSFAAGETDVSREEAICVPEKSAQVAKTVAGRKHNGNAKTSGIGEGNQ